ncbi:MAG: hypothetical protein H7333_03110 [Bdellovibrionales bacterium]|nr:hypothetical protein [Oligoflexia bacterium]
MTSFLKVVFCSALTLSFSVANAAHLPSSFRALNDYVIPSPNQSEAGTCAFMAATGAMEILLNKKLGIHHPVVGGETDLSERFTIVSPASNTVPKAWYEEMFLKFNNGVAVLFKDMPFEFYTENGDQDFGVWGMPSNYLTAPRIKLPPVETVLLFSLGNQYSRLVLDQSHVEMVKAALVKYQSPVIAVGNDEEFWHVVVITGYDDNAEDGTCYELASTVCKGKKGIFFVRDSFGTRLEKRSYEWFIRRQNSASVAKLAD